MFATEFPRSSSATQNLGFDDGILGVLSSWVYLLERKGREVGKVSVKYFFSFLLQRPVGHQYGGFQQILLHVRLLKVCKKISSASSGVDATWKSGVLIPKDWKTSIAMYSWTWRQRSSICPIGFPLGCWCCVMCWFAAWRARESSIRREPKENMIESFSF